MRTPVLLLTALLLACSTGCRAQSPVAAPDGPQKPDPQIIGITQKDWDSLPLKERQSLADYAKWYDMMQNRPWEATNDPASLLDMVNHSLVPEPFPAPMLDKMQKVLPRFQGTEGGTPIAAILYRYGRPTGYDYLAKRLNDHADADAALVFALNKDAAQMSGVLRVLPLNVRNGRQLDAALGDWHDPSIRNALWAEAQKDPDDMSTLLAVANQGVQDALPQARRQFTTPHFQEDYVFKMDAGAAIVKLEGVPQVPKVWQYLVMQVTLGTLPDPKAGDERRVTRNYFIDNAGELRIQEALPTLRAVIVHYLKHGSGFIPGSTYHGTSEDSLSVDAAQAIARMHDTASADLAVRLLVRLAKEQYPNPRFVLLAANAVLDLGGSESAVQAVLGPDEMARLLARRKLKPLPEYLLPKSDYEVPKPAPAK